MVVAFWWWWDCSDGRIAVQWYTLRVGGVSIGAQLTGRSGSCVPGKVVTVGGRAH